MLKKKKEKQVVVSLYVFFFFHSVSHIFFCVIVLILNDFYSALVSSENCEEIEESAKEGTKIEIYEKSKGIAKGNGNNESAHSFYFLRDEKKKIKPNNNDDK